MATRGFLAGLARATAEVALLLDAAGKKTCADRRLSALARMKLNRSIGGLCARGACAGAGDRHSEHEGRLMEMADIFVLIQSDREGAGPAGAAMLAMLSLVMPREGGTSGRAHGGFEKQGH